MVSQVRRAAGQMGNHLDRSAAVLTFVLVWLTVILVRRPDVPSPAANTRSAAHTSSPSRTASPRHTESTP